MAHASLCGVCSGRVDFGDALARHPRLSEREVCKDRMDALTVDPLAAALQEPNRSLLRQVLRVLGPDRTTALLAETLACEASGGMRTTDGTRRRTPGGVFIQLVKARATQQERQRLFSHATPQQHKAPAPA